MKTVKFEGNGYIAPEWVNYIARDYDGDVWVYEFHPVNDLADEVFFDRRCGRTKYMGIDSRSVRGKVEGVEWDNTLTRI